MNDTARALAERALLSALLGSGAAYEEAIDAGLKTKFMSDIDVMRAWEIVQADYRATGQVPGIETLLERAVKLQKIGSTESIPTLVRRVKTHWVRAELARVKIEVARQEKGDPIEAVRRLRDAVDELYEETDESRPLATKGQLVQTLLDDYDKMTDSGGMIGLPFPWKTLNEETRGKERGTVTVFYGLPKNYKTTLAMFDGYCLAKQGVRVYFVPGEMSRYKYQSMLVAFHVGFNMLDYRRAGLSEEELLATTRAKHELDAMSYEIGPVPDIGPEGLPTIERKAKRFSADILVIDGAHKLTKTAHWEDVKEWSNRVLDMALRMNIPIVIVAQANRAKYKNGNGHTQPGKIASSAEDMGGSIAFSQDLSIGLRCRKEAFGLVDVDITDNRFGDERTIHLNCKVGNDLSERDDSFSQGLVG